jgi:hypothetical protein
MLTVRKQNITYPALPVAPLSAMNPTCNPSDLNFNNRKKTIHLKDSETKQNKAISATSELSQSHSLQPLPIDYNVIELECV